MIKHVKLDLRDFKHFEGNIYTDRYNYFKELAFLVDFDEYCGTASVYMLTETPGKKVFLGDCTIEEWERALENKGVVELEKTTG